MSDKPPFEVIPLGSMVLWSDPYNEWETKDELCMVVGWWHKPTMKDEVQEHFNDCPTKSWRRVRDEQWHFAGYLLLPSLTKTFFHPFFAHAWDLQTKEQAGSPRAPHLYQSHKFLTLTLGYRAPAPWQLVTFSNIVAGSRGGSQPQ